MKIYNYLTKKNIIVISLVLVAVLSIAYITIKNYRANVIEDGINYDINQWISVTVKERSNTGLVNGLGIIEIEGGCMPGSGGTQNGAFKCLLSSTDRSLEEFDINSITYNSNLSGKTHTILSGFENSAALRIKTSNQSLFVVNTVIESDGKANISYGDENGLLITSNTKLQHGPGDCTGDGKTDDFDFIEVIRNFGGSGPEGDCTGDGKVDDFDFIEVIRNFGKDYNQQ